MNTSENDELNKEDDSILSNDEIEKCYLTNKRNLCEQIESF